MTRTYYSDEQKLSIVREALKVGNTATVARRHGIHNSILTNAYWQSQGLISLVQGYTEIHQRWPTAGCGFACPVV